MPGAIDAAAADRIRLAVGPRERHAVTTFGVPEMKHAFGIAPDAPHYWWRSNRCAIKPG
jgi:hypothetical protein